MSSHQRFSAALVLIVATVGLGACGEDPTSVHPIIAEPSAPVQPLGECTKADVPGLHGDTIVEAIHGPAAARAAEPQKLVE